MPKYEMVYVGHMLDKAREALSLARGKTRQDYDKDIALRLALTHLIQIIGEAPPVFHQSFESGIRTFPGVPLQVCVTRSCTII